MRWMTRVQNFAKGLTDGCFMEGFMRMKRVPGRYMRAPVRE